MKLPSTQENCTSASFYWVSDKCTKTAPAVDPVTPVEETPQQVTAADCVASGKYWQESTCVSSCGDSFKLNDGWCDRQRYTPAEAAAILNGDDNTITITFKK